MPIRDRCREFASQVGQRLPAILKSLPDLSGRLLCAPVHGLCGILFELIAHGAFNRISRIAGGGVLRVLRLGLAQIDCTVGAIDENVNKIVEYAADAAAQEVDLAVFPELAICGYPPEDLLFKPQFIEDALAALERLAHASRAFPETTLVAGCLDRRERCLYNAAAVIRNGSVLDIYHKHRLPNYGVFDEKRYFTSGRDYLVLEVAGILVGVSICEDIWYAGGPPGTEVDEGGAKVVVNLNASPYHIFTPNTFAPLFFTYPASFLSCF